MLERQFEKGNLPLILEHFCLSMIVLIFDLNIFKMTN